jgi:hypothetical protein
LARVSCAVHRRDADPDFVVIHVAASIPRRARPADEAPVSEAASRAIAAVRLGSIDERSWTCLTPSVRDGGEVTVAPREIGDQVR